MKRFAVRSLLLVIVSLLSVEALLRVFDPWGIDRYFADWTVLYQAMEKRDVVDYTQRPGIYHLAGWTATELPDYTRLLPDSGHGACSLVFIGDSVTWSYGVDDQLTFANRIAVQFPDVTMRNAAFSGYDSGQVRDLVSLYPADVYIYLVISNDPYAREQPFVLPSGITSSSLRRYILYVTGGYAPSPVYDWPRFWRDMDALQADGRVTFIAFDEPFGHHIAQYYPVHLISFYHTTNSRFDGHPDARGHAEIAAAMLPIVREAVAAHCAATI